MIYRYHEGAWTNHRAINCGRLRFETEGTQAAAPRRMTHKAEGVQQRRHIELIALHIVEEDRMEGGNDPADSIYTS